MRVPGFAGLFLAACGLASLSCSSGPDVNPSKTVFAGKSSQKEEAALVREIDKMLVKHNDPGKVDLGILVDKSYIDLYKPDNQWWDRIKQGVLVHSVKRFREQFGIEIEIDGVDYIQLDLGIDDPGYLFTQFMLENDPGQYDALLTFVSRPAGSVRGLAEGNGNHALVFTHKEEHRTIQHELSHWFNAIDINFCDADIWNDADEKMIHPVFDQETIMTHQSLKSDKWNTANTLRINNKKNRSWTYDASSIDGIRKYIAGFDEKHQEDVKRLVCYSEAFKYHEKANQLAKKLCRDFPDSWKLRYYHAVVLEKSSDPKMFSEKIKRYKEIIEFNPDAWVLNNIAWDVGVVEGYLLYLGIDCIELAKKSVKMDASDYNLDTLGCLYYSCRDYKNAVKFMEMACSDTKSLSIATNLARVYHKTKNLEGFRKAVKKMFEVDPEEGMIHYNYSTALMTRFADKLDDKARIEALDIALQGFEIYPSKTFALLVFDAYMFNVKNLDDKEFNLKYQDRIGDIIGRYLK